MSTDFSTSLRMIGFITAISLLTFSFSKAQNSDTASAHETPEKPPVRVYTTQQITTPPRIDGKLDDEAWKTGEWSSNFTQLVPDEGAKPSQKTELKILYDDENVYVALRAYDTEPDKIQRIAGPRDAFRGDMMGVNFDSYNDNQTGFEFNLTAYGQKIDLVLTNPSNWDVSWNPVWEGKVGMEDSAWVAEMRIPFSQLRYSGEEVQTWGLHCWRWIGRLSEEADWEVQTLSGPGMIYNFGDLEGIRGIEKARRIEILPYSSGQLETFKKEPGNPFADDGRDWGGNVGLNAKVGLTSNFTLDMAVNPDFGQVEADPSVINLSAFETFYEEKRPFFVEGKNLFQFDIEDIEDYNLFYSRRIGSAPSYQFTPADGYYVDSPELTNILSAVKVSGKTSKNLSVGILQGLTAKESATISDPLGNKTHQPVEPLTNYTVTRIQKNYNDGNTIIGGILTTTNRFINSDQLEFLNDGAYTGGIDLLRQWNDKKYYLDAKLIGSTIQGSEQAITLLQQSPARYYQRPDAGHVELDPNRTSLSGHGGKVKAGKGTGLWRYSTSLSWYSPGLELNDLGYMRYSDVVNQVNELSYFVTQPVSIFRTYSVSLMQHNNWNFDGDYLGSGFLFNFSPEFRNRWGFHTNVVYLTPSLDTHILRGGYAMKMPSEFRLFGNFSTDGSKDLSFGINYEIEQAGNNAADSYEIGSSINARITDSFHTRLSASYSNNHDKLQYVTTVPLTPENRYILGTIEQETVNLTLRVDYIITPDLSIRFYGSPFVSRGRYSDFKYASHPQASDYDDRFTLYSNPQLSDGQYQLDEDGNGSSDTFIADPDFSFRQFRSNLVLKWEFRPGSDLYLVWSSDRTGLTPDADRDLGHSMKKLWDVVPDNIFLVKFNYWISL